MSRHHDLNRDPCPWVVLNDAGGAFAMGGIGGSVIHFVKGARNAPRGERFTGALAAMKARAPVSAGGFAVWGGLFSTFDCAFAGLRGKKDAWNSIMSGFTTGGVLAARAGWKASLTSATVGGLLLGMIEGAVILMSRSGDEAFRPQAPILPPELQQQAAMQQSAAGR
ncbi:mitochondrial import inner membrane translocase subunit [Catenaria anguillulae PL171]|uniref:Mitochondrial import inner membrane translocase subunit n=1 Tax=Catenaria anguillulae PL171 TaxID=765915 RepID=A0A1Y2I3Y2_9FUNG|nr:mitochondrial import inner membrane translocase subunit [Catenaria anguillulae PL171]